MAGGLLVGAGATALTGTLLLADPLGATEGTKTGAPAVAGPSLALADGAQKAVPAGDAGSVTVERTGDLLKVVAATPAEGWTAMVKRPVGETVKVGFLSNDGAKVHVRAHLTDEGLFRFSVREKGTWDKAAFEAAKAAWLQALADKAAAEKAAFEQARAEKVAAEQAKAKAAAAEADDDGKDHDGWCDKDRDGQRDDFEAAGFDDDDHDWDGGDRDWDDHDGWDGHRGDGHHRWRH